MSEAKAGDLMAQDVTLLVHHEMDDDEIQELIAVMEHYLRNIGIFPPMIDVTVTEDK